MEKQIRDAVNKAIDPEKMKKMEAEINEMVNISINPEQLKKIKVQIRGLVDQTLDTKKIEAMAKEIEEVVQKNLPDAKKAKGLKLEKIKMDADVRSLPAPKVEVVRQTRQKADIDTRLDKLEQKMDRVLKALEDSQKSK